MSNDKYYFVYFDRVKGNKVAYVETPVEQGVEQGHIQEGAFRIFASFPDVERYCESIQEYYQDEVARIAAVSMDTAISLSDRLNKLFKAAKGYGLRMELSLMEVNEHPTTVETIKTSVKYVN